MKVSGEGRGRYGRDEREPRRGYKGRELLYPSALIKLVTAC